jgi:hypothetical protein
MNIGAVTGNDSLVNFFKAVETARQRNVAAFEHARPSAASEAPAKTNAQGVGKAGSQHRFYQPDTSGVNTAPGVTRQSSGLKTTKVLGNFFDAYA